MKNTHERRCEAEVRCNHVRDRCSRMAAFRWVTAHGEMVLCGTHANAVERRDRLPVRRVAWADGAPLPKERLDA